MTEARLLNLIADLNDTRGFSDATSYESTLTNGAKNYCVLCKKGYNQYYILLRRSRFLSLARVGLIQKRICPACISEQTLFPDYDFWEKFGKVLEKIKL